MKIAIVSQGMRQGKSVLAYLLASVFSRSQRRKVALFSTKMMTESLEYVNTNDSSTPLKSVAVFSAMLGSGSLSETELYDYAVRIGTDEVYAFDLFASSLEPYKLKDIFIKTINKVKAELIIVEVNGSLEDEFNQEVLQNMDAILYIFNPDCESIKGVRLYEETYPIQEVVRRTGYICQKYDSEIISEKELSKRIKMNVRNFMLLPYNSLIGKECLRGRLETMAPFIITGNNGVVNLRSKLLEIMQFLYDTPGNKYIRGVGEWYN